ncbi:MAG: hypothetical protein KDD58_02645, partial [Bdellovibrionales bacterium]|nr:hypothetical protein [Bdellovibrionales bacterium]
WWSKNIRNKVRKREAALERWKVVEAELSNKIQKYLINIIETQGFFSQEDFNFIPAEIQQDIIEYTELRDEFFMAKKEVLKAFLNSLRRGELPNPGALNEVDIPDFGKAEEHINNLLGQTDLTVTPVIFDNHSIEGKLRIAEAKLLEIEIEEARIKSQMALLKHEYNGIVRKVDPDLLAKESTLVDIGQLLKMKKEEIIQLMQSPQSEVYEKALNISIKEWENLWKELIFESQIAKPEWYPLHPQHYRSATGEDSYIRNINN